MYITTTTKGRKRYVARVRVQGIVRYLGSFDTPAQALAREAEVLGTVTKGYHPDDAKKALQAILSSNKYVIPKRG